MQYDRNVVIVGANPPGEVLAAITPIASSVGLKVISEPLDNEMVRETVECLIQWTDAHRHTSPISHLSLKYQPQNVIVITESGTPESVEEDMGAKDVRVEWASIESLPVVFQRVVQGLKLQRVERLRQKLVSEFGLRQLVGHSKVFQDILIRLPKLASSHSPVLIAGETGTGKEACARAIHYLGDRAGRPFIPINCSAIPDHLFENEFFGHKRGAFTDAHVDEAGILTRARGGTLFLDEVTSLHPSSQAKLLRLFEEGSYRPLGSQLNIDVNIRFIVATNLDIREEVAAGRFRKDLMYRMDVLRMCLPPLRERGGDEIEELSRHFVAESAVANNRIPPDLSPQALDTLRGYSWPGNVRELKNNIERAVVMMDGDVIGPELLECDGSDQRTSEKLSFKAGRRKAIEVFERDSLANGLTDCGNNITRLAVRLSLDRRTLQRLLQKYQITHLSKVR